MKSAIIVQLVQYGHFVYNERMKTIPVAEVRSNLSTLLKEVESGSEIGISFGRRRETIAVIVPIDQYRKIKQRRLGSLAGKVTVEFKDDWRMSDDEFLDS